MSVSTKSEMQCNICLLRVMEGIVVIKRMYMGYKRVMAEQNVKISTINIYDGPENMRNSSSSSHLRVESDTSHHPSVRSHPSLSDLYHLV